MTRLLFLALVLAAGPALAHDHWINQGQYRSKAGVHCCNANQDCNVVPAKDVQVTPAGFVYKPTGEMIPFDDAKASEDSDYWRCETVFKTTRCFFYPPPGY